jgi:hypothetical protein
MVSTKSAVAVSSACCAVLLAACGGAPDASPDSPGGEEIGMEMQAATTSVIKHVFVIAMENHDASQIYGNTTDAPYINNTLLPKYAHATNFNDELAQSIPSEPHYVYMEAGTNAFSDVTFTGDGDATASNSTSSTAHLVTQIKNATNGVTWMTYQEGMPAACPIASSGFYHAKHNPFVFFKDVSGNPPSKTNAYCGAHHKDYSAFAGDLAANNVASFVFITPNQCHDMHGQTGCPNSNTIRSGDDWLKAELPRIITYASFHAGAIFITWDEGSSTTKMALLAIGPGVKVNYAGGVSYDHGSLVKSIEKILNLSVLSKVSGKNELSDLFKAGQYP